MPFSTASRIRLPNGYTRQRLFISFKRYSHYQTLGVPQDASKAQIKSSFYRLSKQHHPDLSKDPTSRETFNKLNEAYQVLANDRERRAYDRSLLSRSPMHGQSHQPYSPHAPPSRSPRATHAWEHSYSFKTSKGTYTFNARSTGGFKRAPPDYDPSAASSKPFTRSGIHHDVLTGSRKRAEEINKQYDAIRNTNTVFRALQLFGFLAASVTLLSGFGLPGVTV